MKNLFKLLNRFISMVEKIIVSGGMMAIAASVIINVFCRHARIIIVGLEEVAQWGVIWVTFFGTALCARRGIHIAMSAIIDKIPEKQRKIIISSICLITGLFSLYFSFLGWQLTIATITRGQVSPALRIPYWYFYISAPIGFFLTGIYYCLAFIKNLRQEGIYTGIE